MVRRLPLLCLSATCLLGVSWSAALAQDRSAILNSGRKTMTAERMAPGESIVLDGILDEGPWTRAVPATDFIQQDPVFGGTPTERTEVRIVFSRDHLYMGVKCFDSEPDKLLGNTMKRDEFLSADDRFMWTMDTFLDQQSGYFFEMNPSGLMADALLGASGNQSREWDGIWNAKVRQSEMGWTIEIDIPFRTLSFDPSAPAWGINFQRTVRRKNEENLWTGHERNQGLRRMASAGLLLGLRDMGQGRGLELKPYVAGRVSEGPRQDPVEPRVGSGDVGLDVSYNLTPGLRATASLNTDFAETEVDQRRVNLTRFPLFFPEKRTFFLDGATFYDFWLRGGPDVPVQPFFSRRIGLDADGAPQPIVVGAKTAGQVGRQDLGILYVRTAKEGGRPSEDFFVARPKRRILSQSYIGAIYTGRSTNDASNGLHTAGADFRLATSRFRGRYNLEADGFVLWNTNPLDTGGNWGYGGRLRYPNDLWDGELAFVEIQPNLDPAVGFTPQTAYRGYRPGLRYGPRPKNLWRVRQLNFGANLDLKTDLDNRWLTRELDFTLMRVELQTQDNLELSVVPTFDRLEEDFEISSGIILPAGSQYEFTRYRLSGNTANRRIVALRGRVEWGSFFSGDRQELSLQLGIRPRPGITINTETTWNDVTLAEGRFRTRLYRLVVDTQFSPWMYLVNNVQYDSVSGILGWQSRFRWILRPGNDIFLVYTHNWIELATGDRLATGGRVATLDRRAATKVVYTRRF